MKKNWLILGLVGLFLIALTGNAFAWSPKMDGKSDDFRPWGDKGYYISYDNDGFHLWTTTRGAEHVFTGVIKTDGRFVQVRGHSLEGDDRLNQNNKHRNWFQSDDQRFFGGSRYKLKGREVDYGDQKISFRLETARGSDGISFRVRDGNQVTFELYMDGSRIDPNDINIGDDSWHPNRSKFTLYK